MVPADACRRTKSGLEAQDRPKDTPTRRPDGASRRLPSGSDSCVQVGRSGDHLGALPGAPGLVSQISSIDEIWPLLPVPLPSPVLPPPSPRLATPLRMTVLWDLRPRLPPGRARGAARRLIGHWAACPTNVEQHKVVGRPAPFR
eukprot:scaffold27886_cov59-Phaeocystis_antarctica.AAC.3